MPSGAHFHSSPTVAHLINLLTNQALGSGVLVLGTGLKQGVEAMQGLWLRAI